MAATPEFFAVGRRRLMAGDWPCQRAWWLPGAAWVLVPLALAVGGCDPAAQPPSSAAPNKPAAPAARAEADRAALARVEADERRKDEVVSAFIGARADEGRRKAGIEVLAADLTALGSSADKSALPLLFNVLERGEPELRAAAGHAIGMIGPTAAETPALTKALYDPLPVVRDAALQALQHSPDSGAQLLALRARTTAGERPRKDNEGLTPTVPPDAARLGTPVFPGATFVAFASDLDGGRASFTSPEPVQKVADFYAAAAAGRKPVSGEEFSKLYFGGTAEDPTGANAQSEQFQAWLQKAVAAQMPQAELQAESDRRAQQMMSLPLLRYGQAMIFGDPVCIALEVATSAGKTRVVRYVVVFQDLALGRTGIEHQVVADAIRK